MYKPASVLENDTYKLQWEFEGSPNFSKTARPYNTKKKKKKENLQNCGLRCPG